MVDGKPFHVYHLGQVDSRCTDFWQRISQDAGALVRGQLGSLIVGSVKPLLTVAYFTARVGVLMGWRWIGGMFLYYAFGGWVIKRCMPDFKWLWSTASKLDSKFTYEHVRIKTCAESIAFFDGGEKERLVVEDRFERLMAHQWLTYKVEMHFSIIQDVFQTRVPEVLHGAQDRASPNFMGLASLELEIGHVL